MNSNNKKEYRRSVITVGGLLFFIAVLFLAACSPAEPEPPLIGINPSEVCMVNDAVMAKPQIPVPFEGKTYYGCCEGCVGRLRGERAMRVSKDPLTGREVDKAEAFILSGPKGEALYFESSETAKKYLAKNKPVKGTKKQERK